MKRRRVDRFYLSNPVFRGFHGTLEHLCSISLLQWNMYVFMTEQIFLCIINDLTPTCSKRSNVPRFLKTLPFWARKSKDFRGRAKNQKHTVQKIEKSPDPKNHGTMEHDVYVLIYIHIYIYKSITYAKSQPVPSVPSTCSIKIPYGTCGN